MDGGGGGSARGGDVLVVDDHAAIRELVRAALEGVGYAVREAGDGAEALRLVREGPPDLILLDIGMPVMDGRRFLAAYHRGPGPHAPVVLMTAAENLEADAAAGAAGHLPKPFGVAELLATERRVAESEAPPAAGA